VRQIKKRERSFSAPTAARVLRARDGFSTSVARIGILQRERESAPVETASRRRLAFEWPALPHVNTSGNVAPNFNNLDLKPLSPFRDFTDTLETAPFAE
jgi:hypothetical protein